MIKKQEKKMRTIITLLAAAAISLSCGGNTPKCVNAIESTIDVTKLDNETLAASLSAENFNWNEGVVSLTLYTEVRFDANDIKQLNPGDTIVFDGDKIVVETLDKGDLTVVNKDDGDYALQLKECGDGTFIILSYNDFPEYFSVGEACVVLHEEFSLTDCGEEPQENSVTFNSAADIENYLKSLTEYRCEFPYHATTVTFEGGMLKQLTRVWIP